MNQTHVLDAEAQKRLDKYSSMTVRVNNVRGIARLLDYWTFITESIRAA